MKSLIAQGFADPSGDSPARLSDLEVVFRNVVGVALGFAGIVLFIMLLSGGFRYITAGGDPKSVEDAKKTLTYAIAGMVFIALAFLILRFIEQFTGAQVTQFKIVQ
jgi:hypothetical protein